MEKLEGRKVLIVDDNKINIMLAQTVIKKYKVTTDSASHGAEALQMIKNNDYDLVLTDIQMPIMNGNELARAVRQLEDEKKSNLPVLGVTANAFEEERIACLDAGMNDLVVKPYTELGLMTTIASFIKD